MSKSGKSVSLVLGSGGARGHAHVGVIDAIEQRGLDIRNIAGSSMGSVIGGIYAAGELATYTDWVSSLSQKDILRLLDFSFTWTSIFKGERIFDVLKELIGDRRIEDLDRGFTAVATAIDDEREIWINSGSLFTAIRASTAVPGVFSPVEKGGHILVDGGLVNPIPIAPTLNDATDLTIAVNLNGRPEIRGYTEDESDDDVQPSPKYSVAISNFVDSLLTSREATADGVPDAADLLTRSFDIMQGAIARLKLAAYAPDIIVHIPRDACSFFDFHEARKMRDIGRRRTESALDEHLDE